ncbi:hypothetical protein [Dickeya solani]|uniref:Uncharacterized protein n=2 Tax=Dickeya solani TaxID=1089444 RepID=A0AAV3KBN7_9GAMM|nr:hypothetical protein [Dickeya solani]AYQ47236.1 hypothetical protein CTB91_01420 [Dickeya solani]AYQ51408.1 hypothetical protein DSOL99_01426 [Dickeya solani]ERO58218.1 hypothetical protein A544_1393 [Dickeya solani D s0432-1]MBD3605821.1 hypothetical protein [Dickeya solani]MBJ2341590.1 hypothetical protein [Dickeya solani]
MDSVMRQGIINFRLSIAVFIRVAIELAIFFIIFFLSTSDDPDKRVHFILFCVFFPMIAVFSVTVELMLEEIGRLTGINSSLPLAQTSLPVNNRPARLWARLAIASVMISIPVMIITSVIYHAAAMRYKEIPLLALGGLFWGVFLSILLIYKTFMPKVTQWYQQQLFAWKRNGNNENKAFSDEHLVVNYFIPWVVIAMLTVGFISWIYYHQQTNLDVETFAFGCGGTAWIISIWITHIAKKQAVIDTKIGVLHFDDDDELDEWSMYFILHAFSAAVVASIFIIVKYSPFNITNIFSVIAIETVVAAIAAIIGVIIGMLRGRTEVLSKK